MLSQKEAVDELQLSGNLNPGPWIQHSLSVGTNAKMIAEHIKGMNSERAYVMGVLLDIGRRAGNKAIMHIFDGYDYMMSINQPQIARICLTHSFPVNDSNIYFGKYDCSSELKIFLDDFIKNTEYDDYDKIIQLCDALSLPSGACIIEKRLVDVALRHGLPEYTLIKWKAYMQLKNDF